jgi:hypothetical protein
MAKKRPPPGKCVHCLAENVELTWDHVFPRAWYPKTTPADLYKWQIPSCYPCNAELGKIEEDLFFRLGLCVDPFVPETADIVQRALRSYKPEFAKNDRDRAARAARIDRLNNELIEGSNIQRSAVYPGLGERWGRPPTQGLGIRVSQYSLRRLTEKIVRGIYFLKDKSFVEPPYVIEFHALTDEGASPLNELLDRYGQEYTRGTGIVIRRAVTPEDSMSAVCEIAIWGQFKMYAFVQAPIRQGGLTGERSQPG